VKTNAKQSGRAMAFGKEATLNHGSTGFESVQVVGQLSALMMRRLIPRKIMCNLYFITTNRAAIINLFRVANRYVGNLQPGVFSDDPAPVIRDTGQEREMAMIR
jgi:hypothetical protein